MEYKEYKVIHIMESGLMATLFGSSSGVPIKKMQEVLNEEVLDGWQLVFQMIEKKKYLLFWNKDAIIITLGR